MPITLADVPEEILERILALVLVQSAELSPRPSWHAYSCNTASSSSHPTVISPLLVCRDWLRIATPIHYRHPVLRTPRHAELLLRALRHTPALAPCVRSLHVQATSPALRELVVVCANLNTLDITVDNADAPPPAAPHSRDRRVVEFCEAFTRTRSIRHLVIRKNAYLTQPNATYVFEQLAKAIARWHKLESVNVAFRLSPSPAANALTQALAAAPRLHTLYTQLPAVWNTTLLDIAQNPTLARIHAGAHLFLAEAKRHPRLVDLIRAGAAPPSPYPGRASTSSRPQAHAPVSFSLAGNARARAASAVVTPRQPPVTVPTWGYERDVPPPTCPPGASSSSAYSRPSHPAASGPHAGYVYAHPSSAVAYPQAPAQAQYYPHGYASGQHPAVAAAGGQYHGYAQAYPVPVVGQAQKRPAGSRRMTAS
ncbi:hypothetical protein C8Q70DRAFT_1048261 [Cubamyces menziesii]|nr:hypothetical protein C8Q70DRAFT_1048261 [Cubamyces menziesii]